MKIEISDYQTESTQIKIELIENVSIESVKNFLFGNINGKFFEYHETCDQTGNSKAFKSQLKKLFYSRALNQKIFHLKTLMKFPFKF